MPIFSGGFKTPVMQNTAVGGGASDDIFGNLMQEKT
jgi:hypothetical protein